MIGSKNNKRKNAPKSQAATLPAGVKVIPAPKSAARRKLLSGPDIQTSGGRRTVHSHPVGPNRAKLLQGSGSQVRSIGVQGASILARPEVARLIDEAIAHNPVPFASAAASAT